MKSKSQKEPFSMLKYADLPLKDGAAISPEVYVQNEFQIKTLIIKIFVLLISGVGFF